MNNEIREKDHEWVKMFHSSIDRLLVSIEKLFESRQPGAFNDELLTDKEVAHILKVIREHSRITATTEYCPISR